MSRLRRNRQPHGLLYFWCHVTLKPLDRLAGAWIVRIHPREPKRTTWVTFTSACGLHARNRPPRSSWMSPGYTNRVALSRSERWLVQSITRQENCTLECHLQQLDRCQGKMGTPKMRTPGPRIMGTRVPILPEIWGSWVPIFTVIMGTLSWK